MLKGHEPCHGGLFRTQNILKLPTHKTKVQDNSEDIFYHMSTLFILNQTKNILVDF